jgi:hypothetical protein
MRPPPVEEVVTFPAGTYVRMQVSNVPGALVDNFDPRSIYLVGGIAEEEQGRFGYVRVSLFYSAAALR